MVNLTINGGSQTLDGIHRYDNVSITNGGILYITPYNGTGTTGTLVLNVTNNVYIDSTSSINGNSRGYLGGAGSSYPNGGNGGSGPSAGGTGSSGFQCYSGGQIGAGGGGGAGYGTVGGVGGQGDGNSDCVNSAGGSAGTTYGTSNGTDIDMGSGAGGGGGSSYQVGSPGGAGGASITINAQNITVSGSILSNGGNGGSGGSPYLSSGPGGSGGGASGGGIKLRAPIINISNSTITANGGSGATTGGGGRIKIYYGTLNETGAIISAGTVYRELIVQGVSLTIEGGSQTLYGIHYYDNVSITNGGILYVTPYNGTSGTGTLTLNVTNNVYIDSTSSINGVSRGYLGGAGGGPSVGGGAGGTGPGAGGNGETGFQCYSGGRIGGAGGGGAGYGTVGGVGSVGGGNSDCRRTVAGSAGPMYGTSNGTDLDMGSGAGGGGAGDNAGGTGGGAGGAAISIYAQNITVSGSILANGGDGGSGGPAYFSSGPGGSGGGASGGGIKLDAPIININNAIITANGGSGATTGGGGRIKIYYGSLNNTGATIGAGTIYYEITYVVGAVITIYNIVTQSIICTQCGAAPCPIPCNVVCPGETCPSTINIFVTWANSGGIDGILIPTATTGGTTISSIPTNVTVPAGSTATCLFTVTNLSRGLHDICIDSGIIT